MGTTSGRDRDGSGEETTSNDTSREQAAQAEVPEDESIPLWKNPAVRFICLFTLSIGVLGLSPLRGQFSETVDLLAAITARIEYGLFNLFTEDIALYGVKLVYREFSVVIVEECTGIYEAVIFASGVIAFPTSMANKAIGVGLGLPLLFGLNIVRISGLLLVGRYLGGAFEVMHVYFWPITMLLMIGAAWMLWMKFVVGRDLDE